MENPSSTLESRLLDFEKRWPFVEQKTQPAPVLSETYTTAYAPNLLLDQLFDEPLASSAEDEQHRLLTNPDATFIDAFLTTTDEILHDKTDAQTALALMLEKQNPFASLFEITGNDLPLLTTPVDVGNSTLAFTRKRKRVSRLSPDKEWSVPAILQQNQLRVPIGAKTRIKKPNTSTGSTSSALSLDVTGRDALEHSEISSERKTKKHVPVRGSSALATPAATPPLASRRPSGVKIKVEESAHTEPSAVAEAEASTQLSSKAARSSQAQVERVADWLTVLGASQQKQPYKEYQLPVWVLEPTQKPHAKRKRDTMRLLHRWFHYTCVGLNIDVSVADDAAFDCPPCQEINAVKESPPGQNCARINCPRERLSVDEYFVEKLFEYKVKWKGYKWSECTWEPQASIPQGQLFTDFEAAAVAQGFDLIKNQVIQLVPDPSDHGLMYDDTMEN
ncbi:hypothetical protein BKA62DRAFT_719075 [Auriculariales sp. MPI-PUGE-AT-0066]|nr:hypothetical protein BKA62DRAFT_719075 [Auriculariales sp. MPI-PUGE-AT-0066]